MAYYYHNEQNSHNVHPMLCQMKMFSIWTCIRSQSVAVVQGNMMVEYQVNYDYDWFSGGGGHKFTVLDSLHRSLIQVMDKLIVEAQQRESEADKLVRDTAIGLEKWDKKTEELVSKLYENRDKHVSI